MLYKTHPWLYTKLTDLGVTTTMLYAVHGLKCHIRPRQHSPHHETLYYKASSYTNPLLVLGGD